MKYANNTTTDGQYTTRALHPDILYPAIVL
jgi:hypothetical protein